MVIYKEITKEEVQKILDGLMVVIRKVCDSDIQEYDLRSIDKTPLGVHFGFNRDNYKERSMVLFGFEIELDTYIDQYNTYHSMYGEQKALNNKFLANISRVKISKEKWLDEAAKVVDSLHQSLYYIREGIKPSLKIEMNWHR